jgi:hypothetical protein
LRHQAGDSQRSRAKKASNSPATDYENKAASPGKARSVKLDNETRDKKNLKNHKFYLTKHRIYDRMVNRTIKINHILKNNK